MAVERSVDELGRIVLPLEIRKHLGIEKGTNVSIIEDHGKIILTPNSTRCKVCGKEAPINQMFVCSDCVQKIKQM